MAAGTFETRARGEGKRSRTRGRLMDAAITAFANEGLEAASVNAIAQAADVSNGTFYNHFRDKNDVAATVTLGIAEEIVSRIDAEMSNIEDPMRRVTYGTRQFIELAASEPNWGRALFRAVWSLPELRMEIGRFLRADLERGVRAGVFRLEIDDLLIDLIGGTVLTAVFLRTSGEAGAEVGARVAEYQLRMLGIAPAKARRAANAELTLGGS